jgi:hypothetical protein
MKLRKYFQKLSKYCSYNWYIPFFIVEKLASIVLLESSIEIET